MDIKAEIGRHTDEAEQIITSYLPEEKGYQKTVIEAMNYSFLAGGKKITADSYVRDLPAVWWKIESNRAVYGCNRDDTYIFTGA